MNKKSYLTPRFAVFTLATDAPILAGSILDGEGGDNSNITPSDSEHTGSFDSNRRGWSSENWSE